MIPSTFDYVAPTTVDEAVAALASAGEDAKIIAGGQSLMPVLRLRLAAPTTLVDLGRVPELRGVREDGGDLVIGAMTTHHDVIHDPLVREHARLLAEATSTVADPQIRHRGTLGGALAHADPAGDLGAPVLALEATLVAAGPSGRRSIPVADFFDDYFTTTLQPDEILVEVRIPKRTGWAARYEKFNRVAHAWSIVAVAATVQTDGGTIRQARVALTNMAAVPVRAHAVEQALVGQPATADTIRAAAERATEGTSPMSDGNADADYRRQLARVLTRRAVSTAADVA
ncbi:xanthine dehydrogenase family protein subunit M [Rhodococcus ruber]|uniref:Carbon monoxide dehydrogenase medium chain n=1 Tax=Rhodococcus ruber TaxID=1830 RepID=A0A098BNC1_9NOCA|nr:MULTISPECIES: xanthine dehydrogenase family protein subunit M [Rhodococcus]RIK04431.1 MAG: xanthine dehydrogenase family protein subunit M [Acidobacteriota bacterium]ATQ29917.1 xanthine dehydrogenase family protein subunit M [Rhodococcus ruber]AUM18939.1 xanthine dehydrogenase family protein subunit M [Rhodococcus ruber]AWH01333.1 xanthine dehydrogenase family protein subunit M [Rhodococcus ruber]AXY54682.1 carbon-monoxide dehydrogenase [Rhodococcus ruber]